MTSKQRQIKAREMWIKCYEELGSVSKAARKCGIPRSTLYRWINRYEAEGKESLKGRSKRPKMLAKQKFTAQLEALICFVIALRKNKNNEQQITKKI